MRGRLTGNDVHSVDWTLKTSHVSVTLQVCSIDIENQLCVYPLAGVVGSTLKASYVSVTLQVGFS